VGAGDSTANRAALVEDLERGRGELHRLARGCGAYRRLDEADAGTRLPSQRRNVSVRPHQLLRLAHRRPRLQPSPDGHEDESCDRLIAMQPCAVNSRGPMPRHAFPDTMGSVLQRLHDAGGRLPLSRPALRLHGVGLAAPSPARPAHLLSRYAA